jgi:ubiquinone/menaquinone biosynthesis C-methylase UbiE
MTTKYDKIGLNYNLTRAADDYLIGQFELLLNLKEGGTYLDIGCGTGNYTTGLFRDDLNLIGVDPSKEMLTVAKRRNVQINWLLGTAEKMPLKNDSVDGVFGCMTIHHWSNINKGFSEIHRILKHKGPMVIFTSTAEQMQGYWLNHYFPTMMSESIKQMPTYSSIEHAFVNAGFTIGNKRIYNISNNLKDQFLYSGKNDPKRYLDPSVRNGISSFASLAYQNEVEAGLSQLAADINSRKIDKVMEGYKNSLGDYVFFKAEKLNGQ